MTWGNLTCQPCEWEVASSFLFNFKHHHIWKIIPLFPVTTSIHRAMRLFTATLPKGWTQGDGGPRLFLTLYISRRLVGSPQDQNSRLRSSSPKLKNSPRIFNVYRNSVSIKYLIYLIWNDWKMSQSFQNHHWKTRKILEYMSASSWQLTKVHFPLLSWSGLWGVESLVMSCDGLHLLSTGASVKRGDIQKTNPSMMPVSTKNNVKKVKENDEFNESQASLNF